MTEAHFLLFLQLLTLISSTCLFFFLPGTYSNLYNRPKVIEEPTKVWKMKTYPCMKHLKQNEWVKFMSGELKTRALFSRKWSEVMVLLLLMSWETSGRVECWLQAASLWLQLELFQCLGGAVLHHLLCRIKSRFSLLHKSRT